MLPKCNSCKHYAKTSVIQTNKLIIDENIHRKKPGTDLHSTLGPLIGLTLFWTDLSHWNRRFSVTQLIIRKHNLFFTNNNWTILFWFYRCFVVFYWNFYLLQMVREMTSLTNWTPFWKTTDVSNSFVLFRYCCRRTVCFDRDSILNKLVDVCVSVFWLGWYGC